MSGLIEQNSAITPTVYRIGKSRIVQQMTSNTTSVIDDFYRQTTCCQCGVTIEASAHHQPMLASQSGSEVSLHLH
jgi:hypothetical protein